MNNVLLKNSRTNNLIKNSQSDIFFFNDKSIKKDAIDNIYSKANESNNNHKPKPNQPSLLNHKNYAQFSPKITSKSSNIFGSPQQNNRCETEGILTSSASIGAFTNDRILLTESTTDRVDKERRSNELFPKFNCLLQKDSARLETQSQRTKKETNIPGSKTALDSPDTVNSKRYHQMSSNIFHIEPKKVEIYLNNQQKQIEEKKTYTPKPTCRKSNFNSTLNWKTTNTEILFDRKSLENDHPLNTDPNASAKKKKMKNLTSMLDNCKTSSQFDIDAPENRERERINNKDDKEMLLKNLSSTIDHCYGKKSLHMRKSIEQISSLHPAEFYKKIMLIEKQERQSNTYQIDQIKDLENLDLKDIKTIFHKDGIHVYDMKPLGTFYNSDNGKVSFKIRQNNTEPNFDDKIKTITKKINDKGMNMQPKNNKINQLRADIAHSIPADMEWHHAVSKKGFSNKTGENSNNTNMTGLNLNLDKITGGKIAITKREKFNNAKTVVDYSYKNNDSPQLTLTRLSLQKF